MRRNKPIIGLTCSLQLRTDKKRQKLEIWREYTQSVELAGGVPVLLPVIDTPSDIDAQLDLVDGLVLIGGEDYPPKLYGAERHPKTVTLHPSREFHDLELARAAIRRKVPILGVCGGLQLVNIVSGGDLVQHLPDAVPPGSPHSIKADELVHDVTIEPDSLLARILGTERLEVNSSHHQAAGRPGAGLRIAARSTDGVIEALESKAEPFCLCVQWHPERLAAQSAEQLALFRALVEAARHNHRSA